MAHLWRVFAICLIGSMVGLFVGCEMPGMPVTEPTEPTEPTDPTEPTKPTVSFSPEDGAKTGAVSDNITITFGGAVFADAAGTAFTSTTADNLIVLKRDNASGADIAKEVTIAGTVITINPTNDFSDGDIVYVAVTDNWYYGAGSPKVRGSSERATFTVSVPAEPVEPPKPKDPVVCMNGAAGADDPLLCERVRSP